MAYKQVGWKDYPDKKTPLNAQNLKHMEDGIVANDAAIGDISKISGIDDGTLAGAVAAQNTNLSSALKVTSVYNSFVMEANVWREITPEMAGLKGISVSRIVAAIPLFVIGSSGSANAMSSVVVGSVAGNLSVVPNVRFYSEISQTIYVRIFYFYK